MNWKTHTFPTADDPNDVEWMIVYWRTIPCPTGNCAGQDYQLEARQFDHLPKGTTLKQANDKLDEYAANRRASGFNKGLKNHSLFLLKVQTVIHVNDSTGAVI